MKISKTLFKNLMRCPNFASLLNMHQNRAAHDVKVLNNLDEKNIEDIVNNIQIDDLFHELSDDVLDIFSHMFDSVTGKDLTNVPSAQLEAFKDTFKDVEMLAIEQAKRVFKKDIVASENTYEQKKFAYSDNTNEYYCYLDGYLEDEDAIRVFEIKATTSKKFDELEISKRGTKTKPGLKLPMFEERNGVMEYIAYDYLGKRINGHEITQEDIYSKEKVMIDPYTSSGKYILFAHKYHK